MKRIALLFICLALGPMYVLGAVAPYDLKDLESSSTHILSGKVSAITSRTHKSKVETAFGVHRDRVYTVKLAVTKVSKGTGVKAGDVVNVLLWQPSTRVPTLAVVEPNLEKAHAWFRRGAETGDKDAQFFYAWVLARLPLSDDPNLTEAFTWAKRAAAQEHADAKRLCDALQREMDKQD